MGVQHTLKRRLGCPCLVKRRSARFGNVSGERLAAVDQIIDGGDRETMDFTPEHARDINHIEPLFPGHARVDHLLVKAKAAEMLHGAHPDGDGAGVRIDGGSRFDNQAIDATPGEVARKRKPDWTGANDNDGNMTIHRHICTSFSAKSITSLERSPRKGLSRA
jgi:hypothetical protein